MRIAPTMSMRTPPYTVGSRREIEGNDGVAEQRQREEEARLGFIKPQADQLEN